MRLNRSIYYLFFILISFYTTEVWSQVSDSSRYQPAVDEPLHIEKVRKEKQHIDHDIRIGLDISTLILGAITPIRTGVDLSVEYNIKPKLFVVAEGGYNYYKRDNDRIIYISKGSYIRLGIDYNVRNSVEPNDHDIYYIGFRYGYSQFTQEVPYYLLLNGFWGSTDGSMAEEDAYAHWVELLTGFKVEVLKNFYLGMGVRFKWFLHRSKKNIEPVQFVPGYAKNYSSMVINFNYTLYYNIPLNYKKKKIAVYEKK